MVLKPTCGPRPLHLELSGVPHASHSRARGGDLTASNRHKLPFGTYRGTSVLFLRFHQDEE